MAHLGSGIVTLQRTGAGDPGTLKYTGATATSPSRWCSTPAAGRCG